MSKKTFYTILLCGLAVAAWGQVELRYQAPLNFWAYNGLTRVGFDSLELGGPLVKNTEINATAAGYNLTITGSHTQNAAILTVSNTNASAIQNTLRVTAAGAGTYALEAAGNVFGALATGSVVGWDGFSSGGVGLRGRTTNSTGNSALDALRISRQTTGTPASGLGVNIDMSAQISSGSQFSAVRQRALWTDANSTSATARYEIDITDNLVQARKLALEADGRLILDGYSTNSHIGTGWAKAVFGADGTIYADTTTSSATVSGSGTAGTIPVWTSSTTLGDSPLTVSGTDVTATGTSAFRVPVGTTAQQPGTPVAGMTRYNTTNGALEYRGASAWEVPVKSASTTGLGTSGHVLFNDANGRATGSANLFWATATNRLGIGTSSPGSTLDLRGDMRILKGITGTTVINNSGGLVTGLISQVNSSNDWNIVKSAMGNHAGGVAELIFKSRSTNGTSYAAVQTNDVIYTESFVVDGGSSVLVDYPAQYNVQVDGAKTANNFYPARMDWYIRTNLNTDTYHRLAFRASGRLGVLTTDPQQTLHVAGKIRQDTLSDVAESIAGWTGTTGPGVATRVSTGVGLSLSGGTLSAQNLGNSDLTNTSALRTYNIPNGYAMRFADQGGGNNFLVAMDNRGFYSNFSRPRFLVQMQDTVTSQFASILVNPDSVHLTANEVIINSLPRRDTVSLVMGYDNTAKQVVNIGYYRGSISDSTDVNGDVTVSVSMPDATFTATVQVTGTTLYHTVVHDKTTSGFKVRLFDSTGTVLPGSTAVTFDYTAIDN